MVNSQEKTQINITEVIPESSVVVTSDGQELTVGFPAKIQFAKVGLADVTMSEDGIITYLRMQNTAPKRYPPRQSGWGGNKSYPKQNYGQGNSYPIKSADQIKEYYFVSQVEVLEAVTMQEFKSTYNALSKENWVVASNLFQLPNQIKTEKKDGKDVVHALYDASIFLKIKKDGKRPSNIPDANEEVEF